jgi:micrococcal nuclease
VARRALSGLPQRAVPIILATLAPILTVCSPSEPQTGSTSAETTTSHVAETSTSHEPAPMGEPAIVTRVIDGDTIEVDLDGEILDVRLIGIDMPETVDPSEPVGCYGPAGSHFTTKMLEGQEVGIEFDVERLDRYGRTLAYLWLGDELFNEVLVSRGFAQVGTYPPNVKYVDVFVKAQREARSLGRGLWGATCSEPEPETAGGGGGNCDPSYPGVCIAVSPPDLDCADVPYTNFEVTGSDPHGFDGDRDGVGCEA